MAQGQPDAAAADGVASSAAALADDVIIGAPTLVDTTGTGIHRV